MNMGIKKSLVKFALGIYRSLAKDTYDYPIDINALKDNSWIKFSQMPGVDIAESNQLKLLGQFCSKFKKEYENLPREETQTPSQFYINNGTFESVDAEILYCMIRQFKPKRIIEIGSGNSTYLSAQAVLKNKDETGFEAKLISIEPYPNQVLRKGFPGLSKLVVSKVQDIPLSEFSKLEENDILFIDSTHVLKGGSDVQYEYLEILPRLNSGVIVHAHDIFIPSGYPEYMLIKNRGSWNEQYVLQAFLAFNKNFEVLWAGSHMHLKHPDALENAFSSYKRKENWPGSFWFRRVR
jgi:hypothetical protein